MIYLKIIDEKDNEVEVSELTDTGLEMLRYELKELSIQLSEAERRKVIP